MERAYAGGEGTDDLGVTIPCDSGSSRINTLKADDAGQTGPRDSDDDEEGLERSNNRADFERMSSTRSFYIDGDQTRYTGEEYSNRADLERMVSRRTFPVDVGGGRGGNQARRSSVVTNVAESQAGGTAAGTDLHSDMVKSTSRLYRSIVPNPACASLWISCRFDSSLVLELFPRIERVEGVVLS